MIIAQGKSLKLGWSLKHGKWSMWKRKIWYAELYSIIRSSVFSMFRNYGTNSEFWVPYYSFPFSLFSLFEEPPANSESNLRHLNCDDYYSYNFHLFGKDLYWLVLCQQNLLMFHYYQPFREQLKLRIVNSLNHSGVFTAILCIGECEYWPQIILWLRI